MTTAAPASRQPEARLRARGRHRPWLVRACRATGRRLAALLLDLEVTGREHAPQGAYLLAGNHTCILDGPLTFLLAPHPTTFLVKSEMYAGPLARALGWLGQVPVHRGRADREALRAALAELRRGRPVGVFPEGTRGAGDLAAVQHGLAYLALRAGVPVVPVAVLGTAEALPRGRRVPRRDVPVRVVFGPPYALRTPGDPRARSTVAAAAEEIRLHLVTHLERARSEPALRQGTMEG